MDKELIARAIEHANKPLVEALGQVKAQLQVLTRMQMLGALYEREEVRRLVAELQVLRDRDQAAWEVLDAANRNKEAVQAAFASKKATSNAVDEFKQNHPLISELVAGSGQKQPE